MSLDAYTLSTLRPKTKTVGGEGVALIRQWTCSLLGPCSCIFAGRFAAGIHSPCVDVVVTAYHTLLISRMQKKIFQLSGQAFALAEQLSLLPQPVSALWGPRAGGQALGAPTFCWPASFSRALAHMWLHTTSQRLPCGHSRLSSFLGFLTLWQQNLLGCQPCLGAGPRLPFDTVSTHRPVLHHPPCDRSILEEPLFIQNGSPWECSFPMI